MTVVLVSTVAPAATVTTAHSGQGGVDGSAAGTAADRNEEAVSVDVHVSRRNATTLTYRLDFEVSPEVDRLRVFPYAGVVSRAPGFDGVDGHRSVEWTGGRRPSLTVTYDIADVAETGCVCVVTERFVVAPPLRVRFTTDVDGHRSTAYLSEWLDDRTVDSSIVVENGLFRPNVVFVGPSETATGVLVDGRPVEVVAPRRANASADQVVRTLEVASTSFPVGSARANRVTVVVVPNGAGTGAPEGPNALHARGVYTGRGYAYVDAESGPSTWIHEYVHDKQNYTTEPSMRWFDEATAEYYGRHLAAVVKNDVDDPTTAFEGPATVEGVLVDPDSWESYMVPYERGGRAVAELDGLIRASTGGERTFVDVYRRLNGRDGLVLADLKTATATVVGDRSLDDDIDRLAANRETVAGDQRTNDPVSTGAVATPASDSSVPKGTNAQTAGSRAPAPTALASVGAGVMVLLGIGGIVRRRRRYRGR